MIQDSEEWMDVDSKLVASNCYVLAKFMGEGQGLKSGFFASTRKSKCLRSSVGIFFYQLGESVRG